MTDHKPKLFELFMCAITKMQQTGWHWFDYHFRRWPPHSFAQSLLSICLALDQKKPGLGTHLLLDVATIGGQEKYRPHYDQLMQKLAEILVLDRLLNLSWPEGVTFHHEPEGTPRGKRPELYVSSDSGDFLFEVKAPSLLDHAQHRSANAVQLPTRAFPLEQAKNLFGADGITFPRDNPVKDFLQSADEKFQPFKIKGDVTGILVIVWDDFIYEPITALVHERSGLLTSNSFARDEDGQPLTFPNVDAVILIRHLMYFENAAGDRPLLERTHAFDFGDANALPNVYLPLEGRKPLPTFLTEGLRALSLDDPFLQAAAEYMPNDIIQWLNI